MGGAREPGLQLGVGVEELGDAEVEQADLAALRDQDVRGLEVAVYDQVRVGVGDGFADGEEELDPLVDGQPQAVRGRGDALPFDVLEDQVRNALVVDPSVEQQRDAAVREPRQRLALDGEALPQLLAAPAGTDALEGDLLRELGILAPGQPDFAHAAFAEERQEPVPPDRPRHGSVRGGHRIDHLLGEQPPVAAMRRQHRGELAAKPIPLLEAGEALAELVR